MFKKTSIIGALLVSILFAAAAPAPAAEAVAIPKQTWSFAGPFGTYDRNQLQRGFQIFREVCSSCHSARLLAFRNLGEPGGPEFTEGQVKALAAEYEITDPDAETGVRPGIAADRWPSPFPTARDAMDANGGIVPPDFSVIAKARGTTQPFPWWILNYFTPYAEGGPDYIYALLTGYEEEVPPGTHNSDGTEFELPEGKHFNHVFPGHALGMAPPLSDGLITYGETDTGSVPLTVDQYAHDVAAFLMWVAEPHLVQRKEAGLQVIAFLILFAGLMYLVKRKLWSRVEH